MKKLNLFIPQWQDSGFSNELYYGGQAIFDMLKESVSFEQISVSSQPGIKKEKGIYGYSIILEQLEKVKKKLAENIPEVVFTVGGGCGVEVPLVSYLKKLYGTLELFWFDAHGDINSPQSSPSGYFHGMPLRFLLERIEENEISDMARDSIPFDKVLMIGVRDLDPPEAAYISEKGIETLTVEECLNNAPAEKKICRNSDMDYAYVHIDLDVIDPSEFRNVKCPAKGGISIKRLDSLIKMIKKNRKIAGISILENMETDRKELKKLQPLFEHGMSI